MPELYTSHGEQLLAGTVAEDPMMFRVISSHPFLGLCRGGRMAQRWKWWSQETETSHRPILSGGMTAPRGRCVFASKGFAEVAGGSCRHCALWQWRTCSLPDFLTEGVKNRGCNLGRMVEAEDQNPLFPHAPERPPLWPWDGGGKGFCCCWLQWQCLVTLHAWPALGAQRAASPPAVHRALPCSRQAARKVAGGPVPCGRAGKRLFRDRTVPGI